MLETTSAVPPPLMGGRGCSAKCYKSFPCLVSQFVSYLPSPSMKECDHVRIGQSSANLFLQGDAAFCTFAFPDYFSHLWTGPCASALNLNVCVCVRVHACVFARPCVRASLSSSCLTVGSQSGHSRVTVGSTVGSQSGLAKTKHFAHSRY